MKRILFIIIVSLFLSDISHAAGSGAEFLKIDTDARAVSMGSAFTAVAAGVNSIAYNPAGLASARGVELGFSHTNWIMDSKHDFFGIAMPAGRSAGLVIGLGLVRLSNSGLDGRNDDGSAGGGFSSYDQAVSINMAKTMGKTGVGIGVKYIESAIAGIKANAAAVDLGVSRKLSRLPVSLGLSVQNLGTPMKYISQNDPLPLTFSAGLLVGIIPGFNVALDVKRLVYDKETTISAGTEYAVLSNLSLRTGYLMDNGITCAKNKGFSLGGGINLWNMQLDYALTPYGELGNAQKISFKKRF